MSIWDRLFGSDDKSDNDSLPNYRFGRYSDAYKTAGHYRAWDASLEAFEDEKYLEAFEYFLQYLSDPAEENVKFSQQDGQLYFEFYQGSKRVTGFANNEQFRAEAKIARMGDTPVTLLQRLTAVNYELKYSRFAIDGDRCLSIVFDTPLVDASPHKLYHALKEMALQADKQDDLLLEEFKQLLPVEINHLRQLNSTEKAGKLGFLNRKIEEELTYLASNHCNPEEHPGAIAYLLLDLVYKLDFLIIPEGYTMEALERMHRMYFAREESQPVTYKNVRLLGELQQLVQRAPELFDAELYAGKSTFGLTLPVDHDRIRNLIDRELANMDWYQDNGFGRVALAVPGYIIGYSLFNYAIPLPDRDLFELYYRIREDRYFRELGYQQEFLDRDGRPARRAIRNAISEIGECHRKQFPRLRPGISTLEFDNLTNFSRSYLQMIRELDMGKV